MKGLRQCKRGRERPARSVTAQPRVSFATRESASKLRERQHLGRRFLRGAQLETPDRKSSAPLRSDHPDLGREICSFYTLQEASDKLLTKCVNKYSSGGEAALGGLEGAKDASLRFYKRLDGGALPTTAASFFSCAGLFMRSSGAEDHVAFTTSASDFQHPWCLSRMCQIAQRYSFSKPFPLRFSHRPTLAVVTLFRVFSEGRHPLPPPVYTPRLCPLPFRIHCSN